jgi:hypothetical protein
MSIHRMSRSDVRRHLTPYASEIGHATLAWNHLHENLSLLFWHAIGPGAVPAAIWNKLSNDRVQRDMLKTAVEAGAFLRKRPGLSDDVLWLLKETDKLAEQRNVAVHAPLTALTDAKTGQTTVEPQDFFGNKRAKQLRGKDIVLELEWCSECADLLNDFAADLILTINDKSGSWPERPSLPSPPNRSPSRTKR